MLYHRRPAQLELFTQPRPVADADGNQAVSVAAAGQVW
ncbi:hypothetical protein CBM2634_U100010 [Cupriavidus taiwanensis]|uniref:Uncharacterized protein n=1 Tax=Cupriavidus taiwanensis TaxID=164546 RepID=A0A375JBJ6_9BURK|nr:hypothetical protein CBM2634_U100010 [Cupriavidus taiwanensis]